MKKIFVDMDGVLTDFNKRYYELFDMTPSQTRQQADREMYSRQWESFVDTKSFATLDKHAGADELIEYLNSLKDVQLCILSSAGGFARQREVQTQKLKWLTKAGIDWPAVIVPGRKYKAGFASGDAFMIDDTPDVIKSFCENSGNGMIHTEAAVTIEVVKRWLK